MQENNCQSKMHNSQLLGVRQVDRVDLRLSFFVVATFTVITIISYINELNRAGLLDPHRRRRLYADIYTDRHRVERSVNDNGEIHDDALIQRNGQVHQLGLEIHNIKQALNRNKGNTGSQNVEQEINIAVHLGKNASYLQANNSAIRIYHFNNTMPNFYTSLQVPSISIHDNSDRELNKTRAQLGLWMDSINATRQLYRKATSVLVYQHDPGGYIVRDCLRSLIHKHHLLAPPNPLNTQYRREWDLLPKSKRNAFQVLYGGLSFGVCEGICHPCTYMLMVKHPIDRILTVYNVCQKNVSSVLCHFNKLNVQNMTLQQFIKVQGSSFFRKLLYYSKHCKLVGHDEICLPDTKTSFVLTTRERRIYLENILENLEKWFSVVGLEEYFEDSLLLFESISGLNYTDCGRSKKRKELVNTDTLLWPVVSNSGRNTLRGLRNMKELHQMQNVTFKALREKLMQDPLVSKWLSADLAIYSKLEELFQKQLELHNITKSVMKTLQNPSLNPTVASSLNKLKRKQLAKQLKKVTHIKSKHGIGNSKHSYGKEGHEQTRHNSQGHQQPKTESPRRKLNGTNRAINDLPAMLVSNVSRNEFKHHKTVENILGNSKATVLSNNQRSQNKAAIRKSRDMDEISEKIQSNYDKINGKKALHKKGVKATMRAQGVDNAIGQNKRGSFIMEVAPTVDKTDKLMKKIRPRNKTETLKSDKNHRKSKRKGGFLYKHLDSSVKEVHKKNRSNLQQ